MAGVPLQPKHRHQGAPRCLAFHDPNWSNSGSLVLVHDSEKPAVSHSVASPSETKERLQWGSIHRCLRFFYPVRLLNLPWY